MRPLPPAAQLLAGSRLDDSHDIRPCLNLLLPAVKRSFDSLLLSRYTISVMPPHRSSQQRMGSLQRANQIRRLRADDKLLIRSRNLDARSILLNPPDYWSGSRIVDLLLSVPGLGRVKIRNMLERQSISPAKMLAGLTEGQRDRLVEEISHYYKR